MNILMDLKAKIWGYTGAVWKEILVDPIKGMLRVLPQISIYEYVTLRANGFTSTTATTQTFVIPLPNEGDILQIDVDVSTVVVGDRVSKIELIDSSNNVRHIFSIEYLGTHFTRNTPLVSLKTDMPLFKGVNEGDKLFVEYISSSTSGVVVSGRVLIAEANARTS